MRRDNIDPIALLKATPTIGSSTWLQLRSKARKDLTSMSGLNHVPNMAFERDAPKAARPST